MNVGPIVRELLVEGLDDWLPIDRILDVVRDSTQKEKDYRDVVMAVLEELLQQEMMRVGDLGEDGFKAWSGTREFVLAKLLSGLEHFNWTPYGAFCWVANTRHGAELGNRPWEACGARSSPRDY